MARRDFKGRIERLDQAYLNDLVRKVQKGDSNAFAELYASVADRQLCYLNHLFGDRNAAVRALKDAFVTVLRNINSLADAGLFMIWLSRISSHIYYEESGRERAVNGMYTLSQMFNLPMAESQIILMTIEQGLSPAETSEILNISTGTVRRFVKLGKKHMLNAAEGSAVEHTGMESVRLDPVESAEILDAVYSECGRDANSVPMEALSSYAVYRKERFSLQRGILAGALVIFILLPLLFIVPSYTVSVEPTGERGLPVYTIDIASILPVSKVLADVRDHRLPVYEASAREFTVEPTRNGKLTIDVELVNRQKYVTEAEVSDVDSEGPVLLGNETEGDTFLLHVEDKGIGVNYRKIYAEGESGTIYYPVFADASEGIMFEYPDENWDIYIPDHIGNTLHLSLKLK